MDSLTKIPTLLARASRQQYLTQVITLLIAISIGIFLLIMVTGWLLGSFNFSDAMLILTLELASWLTYAASRTKLWYLIRRVPVLLFFLLGLYGSLNVGVSTAFVTFYIISVMLAGILTSVKEMIFLSIVSVCVHHGVGCLAFPCDIYSIVVSFITQGAAFFGVTVIVWIETAMIDSALNQCTSDSLTGLYNRAYFDTEFERIRNSRDYPVAMMMMDINGLKKMNDLHGHHAGDQLIILAGKCIQSAFRKGDIVCRIGGDEFAVLLPKTDDQAAITVLNRLVNAIEIKNETAMLLHLSLAIGYSVASNAVEYTTLIERADTAMYIDKEKSRLKAQ